MSPMSEYTLETVKFAITLCFPKLTALKSWVARYQIGIETATFVVHFYYIQFPGLRPTHPPPPFLRAAEKQRHYRLR